MTRFFDKLEDKIRHRLSHHPILYGLIAGSGVVLFWRGLWHSVDYVMFLVVNWDMGIDSLSQSGVLWWDGPLSMAIGIAVLLLSGAFVSVFIGNEVIMSGLRGEKKFTEKTEREIRMEANAIARLEKAVNEFKKEHKK